MLAINPCTCTTKGRKECREQSDLIHLEHDGSPLSHFFLVLVHFSHVRCARWTSPGDSDPREESRSGAGILTTIRVVMFGDMASQLTILIANGS